MIVYILTDFSLLSCLISLRGVFETIKWQIQQDLIKATIRKKLKCRNYNFD